MGRPVKGVDLPGMQATKQPAGSRFHPLDRSVYNVIETESLRKAISAGVASVERVKVFHFAGKCSKPWKCQPIGSEICKQATEQWWRFRADVEKARDAQQVVRCQEWGEY